MSISSTMQLLDVAHRNYKRVMHILTKWLEYRPAASKSQILLDLHSHDSDGFQTYL